MSAGDRFHPAHDESQLDRLTFFSDAVFAIAMTLLVIEVRLPPVPGAGEAALGQALLDLIPHYIGFLASFLVIGRFWIGHHQLFGLLGGTSDRLLWVNLFFLLAVAFMPFPTAVLSEHANQRVGVGFYAGWLTLLGLGNLWLIRTAVRGGDLLEPGITPEQVYARQRGRMIPVCLGVLAFAAGMIAPVAGLPALAIGGALLGWLFRRRRKPVPVSKG